MQRNTKFTWFVVAAAGLAACGEDSNGNGNGNGGNGGNQACTDAIRAREAEVASQLPASIDDPTEMIGTGNQRLESDFAGKYRDDLANHVGCEPRAMYGNNVEFLVTDNEADVPPGTPANIPGYPCAAKAYSTSNVDTGKPIVILVHGNSSSVTTWEEYFNSDKAGTEATTFSQFTFTIESMVREQLATKLLDEGFEVIAFDARTDLVTELDDWSQETNGNRNIDHGWAVPMLQSLVKAVLNDNPGRQISLVGHSLGVTVVRDALRRLYIEFRDGESGAVNPFPRLEDVILASGANHGVSTGGACDPAIRLMPIQVTCEMGNRDAFVPTYFSEVNNGPNDLYSAPCADGSYAYGQENQCGGNVVQYTTITMEDLPSGLLQDEFVSEDSAALDLEPCVDNQLVSLADFDASGYFFDFIPGFLANHFGSMRSDAGMQIILNKLND